MQQCRIVRPLDVRDQAPFAAIEPYEVAGQAVRCGVVAAREVAFGPLDLDHARAGGDWVADVLIGEAELVLPEIGSSIPLSDVYEGVPFPPEDAATVSGA